MYKDKIRISFSDIQNHMQIEGNNVQSVCSGFRISHSKIFMLSHCEIREYAVCGYSYALARQIKIERKQVRPVLSKKRVLSYMGQRLCEDVQYVIVNSEHDSLKSSPLTYNYLFRCQGNEHDKKGIISYRPLSKKRSQIIELPKFVLDTTEEKCKCFFDKEKHWTFLMGMYGIPLEAIPCNLSVNTILAIYNSRFFSYYKVLYEKEHKYKRNVHYSAITSFPIPAQLDFKIENVVYKLVDCLMYCLKDSLYENPLSADGKAFYFQELIDMCVYEIYFRDYMKNRGLDVFEQLKGAPFMHGLISLEECIEKTYTWLMSPDNIVRQRIILLDTRSPELLGRIHNYYFK